MRKRDVPVQKSCFQDTTHSKLIKHLHVRIPAVQEDVLHILPVFRRARGQVDERVLDTRAKCAGRARERDDAGTERHHHGPRLNSGRRMHGERERRDEESPAAWSAALYAAGTQLQIYCHAATGFTSRPGGAGSEPQTHALRARIDNCRPRRFVRDAAGGGSAWALAQ